jgi:tetratricopeptide (TPR) repeat protein
MRQQYMGFELRSSAQPCDSYTSGLAWTSEFGSRILDMKREPVSKSQLHRLEQSTTHGNQNRSQTSTTANKHAAPKYSALCNFRYDQHSTANLWRNQREIGIEMHLPTHSTAGTVMTQYPLINPEKTMNDFDWEALFASLDTTTPIIEKPEDISNTAVPDRTRPEALVIDEIGYSAPESMAYQGHVADLLNSSQYAFERGMRIVSHDENLSLAVLAFEEACRAQPIYFDAWKMLGSVLADLQREAEAIAAFQEALKLKPNNLEILLRLAVSYTNEGAYDLASQCLEQWIRIKYPQISIPGIESQSTFSTHFESFNRIKDPFIQAARLSQGEENIDADVQVGLGVLMFSAELYNMAADCFHAAIQSTVPGSIKYLTQQHLLWNRYAACLGNIRDKEEMAIQAYETALALKPNFVKARYNLGVLYHNINQPLLGARKVLEGLMCKRTIGSMTKNGLTEVGKSGHDKTTEEMVGLDGTTDMYETLMKCCNSMCRWDLAELVEPNMDLETFKLELDRCW